MRFVQERARDAAKHPLGQLGAAVGADHNEIGPESVGLGQQALINVRFAEQVNLVTPYKVLGGGA